MWLVAAAAWGLAEATLFFIVPDVLLTWLAAFRPRVAWPAVAACLAGALSGGVVMYLAAADAPGRMRAPARRRAGGEQRPRGGDRSGARGPTTAARCCGPGSPAVPYKILAVESGAQERGLVTFLGWSVPARLSRWVLIVLLARGVAGAVRARVSQPDRVLWTLWAAGWGIVYLVYFAVMGW